MAHRHFHGPDGLLLRLGSFAHGQGLGFGVKGFTGLGFRVSSPI